MTLDLCPYSDGLRDAWEGLCTRAVNSTLLHTRRFLSYHGDRFIDTSTMVFHDQQLVGVFPAAQSLDDPGTIISHPGATYGGVVHDGWLNGMRMVEAIEALKSHYASAGHQRLIYKVVPHIYADALAQDDLYALFRHGATRVRCDLSCAIDLSARRPLSERRRRSLRKALKSVVPATDRELLPALWSVVEENLARKHGASPVHTLPEITELLARFPDLIQLRAALINDRVEAGLILFNSPRVWHAQYIASSENGYEISALDAIFDAAIRDAEQAGARYFDFGTSNEDAGAVLNDGLYRFKSEFGGGGTAHEFYELRLC